MVQFKPTGKYKYRPSVLADTYWKLESFRTRQKAKDFLKSHGYHYRENAKYKELLNIVGRCQTGLLPYENFGLEELRTFHASRRLTSKATTVSGLARALVRADEQATFENLFKLPREIRNVIYALYLEDLGEVHFPHEQPPLTKVSRQLRAETLPKFYGSVQFVLTCLPREYYDFALVTVTSGWSSQLQLKQMPDSTFSSIRNLTLVVERFEGSRDRTVSVSFKQRQKKWTINVTIDANDRRNAQLRVGTDDFLRCIGYRQDQWQLRKEYQKEFEDKMKFAIFGIR